MEFFHRFYEGLLFKRLPPPYKANPCDMGAANGFRHLAPYFERLTSTCPCCTGARVAVAMLFGALFPNLALGAMGMYFGWAILVATYRAFTANRSHGHDEV